MERVHGVKHGVWYGDKSEAWRFSLPFYKSKKNSLKTLEGLEHILGPFIRGKNKTRLT